MGETLEFAALTLEGTGRRAAAADVMQLAEAHRRGAGEEPGGIVPGIAAAVAQCRARLATAEPAGAGGATGAAGPADRDEVLRAVQVALEER